MSVTMPTLEGLLAHISNQNSQHLGARFAVMEEILLSATAERLGLVECRNGGRWLTEAGWQYCEQGGIACEQGYVLMPRSRQEAEAMGTLSERYLKANPA